MATADVLVPLEPNPGDPPTRRRGGPSPLVRYLLVRLALLLPMIGVLSGHIFLYEAITWQMLLGGLATLAGVAIVVIRRPAVVAPSSKAGSSTLSVDQPSTHASATVSAPKSTLPSVERAKIHGSRLMATPRTRNPSIRVVRVSSVSSSIAGSALTVGQP